MVRLQFFENQADKDEGLAHAGIETFREKPYASIARECGQNSRDASAGEKVRLTFDRITIPASQLPALDQFKAAIKACLRRASSSTDPREKEFFSHANKLLEASSFDALVIADYGTTGLVGPSKRGTPFHSLVKGEGVSTKSSLTSGGSFGIGKNAAFAISDLHSVFYSTVYEEDGENQFLCQGKCILVSHETPDGKRYLAEGYWGTQGFHAIDDPNFLPDWLLRSERGTSVIALGFAADAGWQERIAESLVRNFFASVDAGEMEFSVDNSRIRIDARTLPGLFEDPTLREAASINDSVEELDFAKHLYICNRSMDSHSKEEEFSEIGKYRVRVLVNDRLPKRVGFLRNGMFITDNLKHFGHKFEKFPLYKDFVATVEPIDEKSKKIFRRLENPQHDGLSVERLLDTAEQSRIRRDIKRLAEWIRIEIRSHTISTAEESSSIDELNELFPETPQRDTVQQPQHDETDPEKIKLIASSQPVRKQPGAGSGTRGGGGGGKNDSGGGSGRGGPRNGAGSGGSGERGALGAIPVSDFRNIRTSPYRREIYFTASKSASGRIRVDASGLSDPAPLKLVGIVFDGKMLPPGMKEIAVTADTRHHVSLELSDAYEGPIEITIHETSRTAAGGEE